MQVLIKSTGLFKTTGFSSLKFTFSRIKTLTNNENVVPINYISTAQTKNVKFVQFTYNNEPEKIRVGYVLGDDVVDLNKADPSVSTTLLGILQNGDLEKVKKLTNPTVPLCCITLKAPIHGMDKILCIGLNYKDHCEQHNLKAPKVPMIFSKFSSTVIGPNDALRIRTDVVKSMDTFCPIGPWIVTCDETGDPEKLDISCSLNGVTKQSSNTSQMIYKIAPVIERLTSVMTLLPGDIILTGTPGGVGTYSKPPEFLKPGDVLCNEIQNIGVLEIKVEEF